MKNNNKKNYDYFDGFIENAAYGCECVKALRASLTPYSLETLPEKVIEIHKIEHGADGSKHEMMSHLLKDFLPPIEREDIVQLAQEIDSVTDSIEDIIIQLDMFQVKELHPDFQPFLDVIEQCCIDVHESLKEFKNYKKSSTLKEKLIELNMLEEKGDSIYHDAIKNLYKNESDPVKLLIWTEIFRRCEKCCDACEDVADTIESVVLKNS